jgi:hypothetical protein
MGNKEDITNQSDEGIFTLNKDSNNLNSQFILPRQGWQDKRAFATAVVKAKKALDIAEISSIISF